MNVILPLFFIFSPVMAGASATNPLAGTTSNLFSEAGLERQVDFWEQVYTRYGSNQVLIHDRYYVYLIYETLEMKGDWERQSAVERAQRKVIESRTDFWKKQLLSIHHKLVADQPLNADEQALRQKVELTLQRSVTVDEFQEYADNLRAQRGIRERVVDGWVHSGRYLPHMEAIFTEMGVPKEILALPLFESSFRIDSVSRKGAAGVWQFIRSTGRVYLRIDRSIDERLDPLSATRGAARFLLDAHSRLGSWPLAVMAYNHGVGGMVHAKETMGQDHLRIIRHYSSRHFGFASRNYYPAFLAALRIFRQPEKFFPPSLVRHQPWQFKEMVLADKTPLKAVLQRFKLEHSQFLEYNPAVFTRSLNLTLPAGFRLKLPPANPLPAKNPGQAAPPAKAAAALSASAGKPAVPSGRVVAPAPKAPKNGDPPPANTVGNPRSPKPVPGSTARQETPPRENLHTVRPGETLFRIAAKYNVTVEQLRRWNNLADNTILPGQKLIIRRPEG